MIFAGTGEVAEGFHVLGSAHTPSYLLDGPRPILFDGGLSHLGKTYVDHARAILGERKPELLLHSHVHFDHCGASATIRQAFPGLKLGASEQGAAIVTRPRALELIRTLNDQAREGDAAFCSADPEMERFHPFAVDLALKDGDRLELGNGETLVVLATPGHTRDFLSYYIPGRKILIASEAAGCAHSMGNALCEFIADYEGYLASLRMLATLEVEVLCQGHLFVYTGGEVKTFLESSLRETLRYRARADELLDEEKGDVASVVRRIKEEEWEPLSDPKQPEAPYLLNTEGRVRHLAALWAARNTDNT